MFARHITRLLEILFSVLVFYLYFKLQNPSPYICFLFSNVCTGNRKKKTNNIIFKVFPIQIIKNRKITITVL